MASVGFKGKAAGLKIMVKMKYRKGGCLAFQKGISYAFHVYGKRRTLCCLVTHPPAPLFRGESKSLF